MIRSVEGAAQQVQGVKWDLNVNHKKHLVREVLSLCFISVDYNATKRELEVALGVVNNEAGINQMSELVDDFQKKVYVLFHFRCSDVTA